MTKSNTPDQSKGEIIITLTSSEWQCSRDQASSRFQVPPQISSLKKGGGLLINIHSAEIWSIKQNKTDTHSKTQISNVNAQSLADLTVLLLFSS